MSDTASASRSAAAAGSDTATGGSSTSGQAGQSGHSGQMQKHQGGGGVSRRHRSRGGQAGDDDTALSVFDPFGMRLGFGNWDNWGLLGPSLLDQPFSTMLAPFGGLRGALGEVPRVPTMDLNETEKGYDLTVDLPGFPKDQVKVDLKGRTLTLTAERKEEKSDEQGKRQTYGTFTRSMVLPPNSDVEKIDAKLEHGQLKICIPKQEKPAERARQITIS